MGVYAGPEITNDSLVLALDAANSRSFRGEATTNEIVAVTWSGDGTNQSGLTIGSSLVSDENLKYNGYETYLWTPGTSLNCYLNGADLSTLRTSTVWTFSCYVRREDGAAITSLGVYMYYPSSDGFAAGTIQDVGNGWYRISRTRTGTDNYLALVGFTGFASGIRYYLSGPQVEKKLYPTTFVATNSTRGTTVATGGGLIDLSGRGNTGELLNGVGENSSNGGSLVFDGVDDYSILNSNFVNNSLPNFTITSWFNKTSDGILFGNHYHNSTWESVWFSTTEFTVNAANNNTTNRKTLSYTAPSNSTWHNLVAVNNSSSGFMKVYLNGVEYASLNATVVPWNSTIPLTIGAQRYITTGGVLGPLNGKISSILVYNRVLTASEIQQNYNATKSRFGL